MLGLLAGGGGSDATTYAGNELKYNYLTKDQRELFLRVEQCHTDARQCEGIDRENYEKIIEELTELSHQQTLTMIEVCSAGPSVACSAMLKEAAEDLEWHGVVYLPWALQSNAYMVNTKRFTQHEGDGFIKANIDSIALDVFKSGLYGEAAAKEITERIVEHNANMKIVNGVVMIAGVAACTVGTVVCAVAVAGAILGANRVGQGVHERVTKQEQPSVIEMGLIKSGISEEAAKRFLSQLETDTAILTMAAGGYSIIREVIANGKILAIFKAGDEVLAKQGSNVANVNKTTASAGKDIDTILNGGFKKGISAEEIKNINASFGGSVAYKDIDIILFNAQNYNSFFDKSASIIRDIAGRHLFNNGNKRTAVEVVERLIVRNGIDAPSKEFIWKTVDRVANNKLKDVKDISQALRGLK